MEVTSTIRLHFFPSDDVALACALERIEAEEGGLDQMDPEQLQERLRAHYPAAVVRNQEPLGALNPIHATWYVYRDGSLHGS